MINRIMLLGTLVAFLSGCASEHLVPLRGGASSEPFPTIFATGAVLQSPPAAAIDSSRYRDRAYLKLSNFSTLPTDEFELYMVQAFQSLRFFNELTTPTPLVGINVPEQGQQEIAGRLWYEQRDPHTLLELKSRFPHEDVLVIQATLREASPYAPYWFSDVKELSFDVQLIDLQSGQTVYHAQKQGRAWLGAQRQIINPVLNQVRNWILGHTVASIEYSYE